MSIESILKAGHPHDVVDTLLDAYKEIESNYALRKWKASELDSGHFVEAARRLLENALFGKYTPIGVSLSNFHDGVLTQYEQATGNESFRILIPRVLKAIYNIRNKRGVGHVGPVSPNEIDSTLILYSVKWVLAEFVRLASGFTPAEVQRAVDEVIERHISILWKQGTRTRILDRSIAARNQVLILLYDQSPQSEDDVRAAIEYKNVTNFRSLLRELHGDRLIEYEAGGTCTISPKGTLAAEALLLQLASDPDSRAS